MQGIPLTGSSEELGGAIEAEVMRAGEYEHVFGLQLADGALLCIFLMHVDYLNNRQNVAYSI